jgi:serine acetyltransferase
VLREEFTDLQPTRALVEAVGSALPHLRCNLLRTALWRAAGMRVGQRTRVMGPLHITCTGNWQKYLSIGKDAVITGPLCIDLAADVRIGDGVRIGHDVLLLTNDHEFGPSELRCGSLVARPITIGEGAWLASRCVVLPGVSIGAGAIVAAGAVVTRDVPRDTLVAGVPARVVRSLDEQAPRSERVRLALRADVETPA